jgi:hypothetical protein
MKVVCTDRDASRHCRVRGSHAPSFRGSGIARPERAHDQKTRFGEIVQGLIAGGAYGFDQESYSRFLALARDLEIPVAHADFPGEVTGERRFFTVLLADPAGREWRKGFSAQNRG